MSTLRMVERKFAPGRSWYSLVDVVTDRVVCGGLRSETEAEQWATGEGHVLANPPARKSGATKTDPPPHGVASIVAPDPSSGSRRPDRPRGAGVQSAAATASPAALSTHPATVLSRAYRQQQQELARAAKVDPPKESFPCCAATLDELNRYCVGDCGPNCLRRAARRRAARRAS